MALPALPYPPAQARYNVQKGEECVVTKTRGGLPRTRRDTVGTASRVRVGWELSPTKHAALQAFHDVTLRRGSLPFTASLILEKGSLETYTCSFVPGTLRLSSMKGARRVIEAMFEVRQNADNATADNALMDAFEATHP